MNRIFYENLPKEIRAPTHFSSKTEIVYKAPLNSQLFIDTAGASTGRSGTFHLLHASEVAYWRDADSAMRSVRQTVPKGRGTEIWIESTANGRSGYFYDLYKKIKAGKSEFEIIFIPWYEIDEYVEPVPERFELTDREKRIKARYHLSDEKMAWRRSAIEEFCEGKEDIFNQEYPTTEEGAFLMSGRGYFPPAWIKRADKGTLPPLVKGRMELLTDNNGDSKPTFIPTHSGGLSLWSQPKRDRLYLLAADVGGVVESSDYHAAYLIDHENGEMCASFHDHLEPDLYAEQLYLMATWYNTALLSVERNSGTLNYGFDVIEALNKIYNYPNLYRSTVYGTSVSENNEDVVGWSTNAVTRPMMLSNLLKILRNFRPEFKMLLDEELLSEMSVFIYNDNKKAEAAKGKNDDRIMALGQAHLIRVQYPAAVIMRDVYQIPFTK